MSQFTLDEMTAVTVSNVNIRSELHGDEHVPAADISIRMTTSNTILSEFDGHLLSMLYQAPDRGPNAQQQPELDGVEPVSNLPLLRSNKIEMPLKLKNEFAGYELTVDRGLGAKSNIVVGDCMVNKVRVDCKEGGTVDLSFRVQAAKLSADVLGKLGTLIGNECEITLQAPTERQAPIDGTVGHPALAKKDSEPDPAWPFPKNSDQPRSMPRVEDKSATDVFVEAHSAPAEKKSAATSTGPNGKSPVKYRDPMTGSTWSGRGLQPKWLKVALNEGGKKLTDFIV